MALVQKSFSEIITFSRASNATRFAPDGVLQYAPHNLLLQSQDFTTTWGATAVTVTANTTTAPDGTSTAETLDDDTANNVHNIVQTITTTTGLTYTLSAFLKNVDRQFAILAVSASPSVYASAKFDLAAGTLGSTQASGAGWSITSSSITSVGNSWYRCAITFVVGTTTGGSARIGMGTDGTTFTASQRGLEVYTGSDKTFFVWGAQLAVGPYPLDYTPTTTAVVYGPRFDYNPTTLAPLGLLIEEQRTNLLLYSEQFDNAAWTKTRSSITANAIVSPNGTLDADKLVEDTTATSTHTITQATSFTSGTTYTFSIFLKAGERSAVRVLFPAAAFTSNLTANFDIATGAWRTSSPTPSAGLTLSAVNIGNGWYRISATATATVTASSTILFYLLDAPGNTGAYTGNGTSGLYIWGAQLETGAFPTSYIPTSTAAVTRSADVASINTLSPWYNAAEGTLVLRGIYRYIASGSPGFFRFDDGTDNERMMFAISNGTQRFTVIDGGTEVVDISRSGVVAETAFTHSAAYKVNDFAACVNGGVVGTDTVGILPTVTQAIFRRSLSSDYPNGWLQRISYYNRRLTNAELQVLTS